MFEKKENLKSEHEPQLERIVSLGGQTLEKEVRIKEPKRARAFILSTILTMGLSTAIFNSPETPASTKEGGKSEISGLLEKLSSKSTVTEIQTMLKNAMAWVKTW